MNRELDVYLDERLIGKLFENSGVWSFQYERISSSPTCSAPIIHAAPSTSGSRPDWRRQCILDKCRTPATARIALFRWTLFNILIGNSDAHLKNLSLYASSEGYELAPHYDLLSIGAWARPELLGPGEAGWPDIAMAFAVGQARHYSELTVAHLQAFGRQLGIGSTSFRRELTRMSDGIEPASLALQEEFAERNDVPAPLRASQLRMLGCIHHLPIKTMVRQLRRPLSGA